MSQSRIELIDEFESVGKDLSHYTRLSPEELDFRPFTEAWTIREHLVHIAESEIAAFHRYRKAIAEPDGPVVGYNEEVWTPNHALGYDAEDASDWVDLFHLLRKLGARNLRRIANDDWSGFAYTHSAFGRVGLEEWVVNYTQHIRDHVAYIERNRKAFTTN